MKRVIAAQATAENDGHGLNLSEPRLKELGYNLSTFSYPSEWDTWPSSWDAEPDVKKLARVVDVDEEIKKRLKTIRNSSKYSPAEKEQLKRVGEMFDSSDNFMMKNLKFNLFYASDYKLSLI